MKKTTLFIFFAYLINTNAVKAQQYNWLGSYTFEKNYGKSLNGISSIMLVEQLLIEKSDKSGFNYKWAYEGNGYQTLFRMKGYAIDKGLYVDFYFTEGNGGNQDDQIDKTRPFFKMSFLNGSVLTKWIQPKSQKNFSIYFKPD